MTIQIKALDEYFPMVVFTLLLNRVHVFANFMVNLNRGPGIISFLPDEYYMGLRDNDMNPLK